MVTCKFKCVRVSLTEGGDDVEFDVVVGGSEENDKFFRYTPWGHLNIGLINHELNSFEPGLEYFINITPANKEVHHD